MTANNDVAERLRATVAKELKQDVSSITPDPESSRKRICPPDPVPVRPTAIPVP